MICGAAGCSLAVIHAPGLICQGASLATRLAALIACYRLRILMKKDYIKLCVRVRISAHALLCSCVAVPMVAENRCFVAGPCKRRPRRCVCGRLPRRPIAPAALPSLMKEAKVRELRHLRANRAGRRQRRNIEPVIYILGPLKRPRV